MIMSLELTLDQKQEITKVNLMHMVEQEIDKELKLHIPLDESFVEAARMVLRKVSTRAEYQLFMEHLEAKRFSDDD